MLLTVTPNACIERTLRLDELTVGRSHRVASAQVREDAGGKGVNAARVARAMGAACAATGWIGHDRVDWLHGELERFGIEDGFVTVDAPTRIATNLLSEEPVVLTEIVEAGHPVSLHDGTRLLQRVEQLLGRAKLCSIGGSFPPTAPEAQKAFDALSSLMVRIAQRHNVPVIADGKGRAFEVAVRAKPAPWCIKPNLDEARELLHRDIVTTTDERNAVLELLRLGPQVVLLSCGERGCYVGMERQVWFLPTPKVETVSPIGSGDALVGAFAARFLENDAASRRERVMDAARWGVAAGAANAARADSGFVTRAEIEALLPQVRVQAQVMTLSVS